MIYAPVQMAKEIYPVITKIIQVFNLFDVPTTGQQQKVSMVRLAPQQQREKIVSAQIGSWEVLQMNKGEGKHFTIVLDKEFDYKLGFTKTRMMAVGLRSERISNC